MADAKPMTASPLTLKAIHGQVSVVCRSRRVPLFGQFNLEAATMNSRSRSARIYRLASVAMRPSSSTVLLALVVALIMNALIEADD